MYYDSAIINGILVDSKTMRAGNLCISNGRIAAVVDHDHFEAASIYDARGNYVLPGLIDAHIHSRDGRRSTHQQEDILHSTMAAACGGITTVGEMPNSFPAACTAESFKALLSCFEEAAYTDYGIWAMTLGSQNDGEVKKMLQQGALGLKLFWGYALDREQFTLIYQDAPDPARVFPPPTPESLECAFSMAAKTSRPVYIHAENFVQIAKLRRSICAADFPDPYAYSLALRPPESEASVVSQAVVLAEKTGCQIHIAHVSSAETVAVIRDAKRRGVPITAETAPHYLTLTNEDFPSLGAAMKVFPLIRTKRDQDALWAGLLDGTLDLIGSDHAPHTISDKEKPFLEAPAGIPGVETTCSVMLEHVHRGKCTLCDFVRLFSEQPAKLMRIYPRKGVLRAGADADVTIVDLNCVHTIDRERLHHLVKTSIYHGMRCRGASIATFLRGNLISENGEIIGLPKGRFIRGKERGSRW